MEQKIFIAYYSWSGNTGHIADLIQRTAGGTLYKIRPLEEYSRSYGSCLEKGRREIRSGVMPPIGPLPDGWASCDTLIIGSPIWCSTMAPPVLTFLSQTGRAGKTIVPFCTHGGGGEGHFSKDIKKYCPGSAVGECLSLYGQGGDGLASSLTGWLRENGIEAK